MRSLRSRPALADGEVTTGDALLLALLDEAYSKKTWHGPNLRQALKGVSAKQAAWRPGRGRHNIWEIAFTPPIGSMWCA